MIDLLGRLEPRHVGRNPLELLALSTVGLNPLLVSTGSEPGNRPFDVGPCLRRAFRHGRSPLCHTTLIRVSLRKRPVADGAPKPVGCGPSRRLGRGLLFRRCFFWSNLRGNSLSGDALGRMPAGRLFSGSCRKRLSRFLCHRPGSRISGSRSARRALQPEVAHEASSTAISGAVRKSRARRNGLRHTLRGQAAKRFLRLPPHPAERSFEGPPVKQPAVSADFFLVRRVVFALQAFGFCPEVR